jgi:hypothetical protein
MLKPVNGFPFRFRGHAHDAFEGDVFICLMYIGIGVMQDIVLQFP